MEIDLDKAVHISETALTIRGSRRRTTVPAEIVENLGLKDGDKLRWVLMENGNITLCPVRTTHTKM